MSDQFLYQQFDAISSLWLLNKEIPLWLTNNLNQNFVMREYQQEAFARFFYYFNQYPHKKLPLHLLFNMATGSGKTFIMAGLILYLYEQWYRNFLFFVNSNNIIEKTKANFLNGHSSKYLFNNKIFFNNKIISIKEVSNFTNATSDDIQIKFTTIQGLHSDLMAPKEEGVTFEDFEDKKIVMLSDEAHHINADTKWWKWKMDYDSVSWEQTIMKIYNSNDENILLEFTATIDLSNQFIYEKYLDKIIFKYDLKEFRLDRYSKEVDILKSDMEMKERILQALILSQYRLKIAEKYKITCKPVILFKSQKSIIESETNKAYFIQLIKNLSELDIQSNKSKAEWTILQSAYEFFESNNITEMDLVRELQQDFAEQCVLSANDDSQASKNQILLNTLEDKDNRIRAIFAVQKLSEGWDVLNLFDIVRLYDVRDGDRKKDGKYYAGNTTMSEAQLIGRGARYFPFVTDEAIGEDKYKRKFDRTDHELKILETFYYHTSYDSKYIAEIIQALREIGIINEKEQKKFILKLKPSFINSTFYKEWLIYTNTRIKKWWLWINSLLWAWIKEQRFTYTLKNNKNDTLHVFEQQQVRPHIMISSDSITLCIKDISKHITRKAIWRNDFYKFDNLQKYLWGLKSIDYFMSSDHYLGSIMIDFIGTSERIAQINNEDILQAIVSVLNQLEIQIKQQEVQYVGSKEFKAQPLQNIFRPQKDIVVDLSAESIWYDKDWFVFEEIVGSSEEKDFIDLFNKKITTLHVIYEEIYLIRSERSFALYSFKDGQRFEPDFVLYMKNKNKDKNVTYQIFIEPKGDQLLILDKRKEDFLIQIDKTAEIIDFNFWKYQLIWLPFYNKWLELEFEKAMDEKFLKY